MAETWQRAGPLECGFAPSAAAVTLAETGSTLMLPLLQNWPPGYRKVAPDVHIPTAGTGSEAGVAAGHVFGTTVNRPDLPGIATAKGNAGVLQKLTDTPCAIACNGASFIDEITKANLGKALLENGAGQFVSPTAATISAAATPLTPKTPPASISTRWVSSRDVEPK